MMFCIMMCIILTLDVFTIFFGTVAFLEKNKEIKELKEYVKRLEEEIK